MPVIAQCTHQEHCRTRAVLLGAAAAVMCVQPKSRGPSGACLITCEVLSKAKTNTHTDRQLAHNCKIVNTCDLHQLTALLFLRSLGDCLLAMSAAAAAAAAAAVAAADTAAADVVAAAADIAAADVVAAVERLHRPTDPAETGGVEGRPGRDLEQYKLYAAAQAIVPAHLQR